MEYADRPPNELAVHFPYISKVENDWQPHWRDTYIHTYMYIYLLAKYNSRSSSAEDILWIKMST